jgi:glycosyltransferase involved in cell wall biosynthesis
MHWPASRGLQASKLDKKLFRELAGRHDIVWFHTLGAAAPFSLDNIRHSVMDLDDLNHCKYDLRSQNDKSLRLRLSATVQAYKWKGHEFDALKQYDIVTVCSRQDKQYLGADNVRVIPNGFAMPPQKPEWKNRDPNRLGFIGTLGYGPNYEGLVWFRNQVWPLLRKQNPKLTLRLIGAPPQPQYVVRADGFEYLGYIEDSAAEIDTWSAMVIPITYGGGTRIKILDAFSKMCPVVSTSIGAHGIAGVHDEHFLLADEPKRFADICLQLTAQPDTARRLAESAWQLFNEKYNWDVIGRSIRSIVEKMMEKR